jgi:hypothetical protein
VTSDGTAFSGPAIGAIAVGGLLVFAGVKGYSLATTVQDVIQGHSPVTQAQSTAITGTTAAQAATTLTSPSGGTITSVGGEPSGTDAENKALGQQMAAASPYNWTGPEWTALNNIVMAESGWSDTVTNPDSSAAGIAQNISGFSADYPSGDAAAQIAWMLAYIKQRYGTPVFAWTFHLLHGYY